MNTSSSPKNDRPEGVSAPEARSPTLARQAVATAGHLTLHRGLDYACILRPGDTTDTALVQVKYPTDEDLALLQQMADGPRLHALINSPETEDFLEGVRRESSHQVERWGEAHDRSKAAENWFWLVGYLAGKALRAAIQGDHEKAKHHTISAASALRQWHAAIARDESGSGVGRDDDLKAKATGAAC